MIKKILRIIIIVFLMSAVCGALAEPVFAERLIDYYDKYREYIEHGGGDMSVSEFLTGEDDQSSGGSGAAQKKIDEFARALPDDVTSSLPRGGSTDIGTFSEDFSFAYFLDLITSALKNASEDIISGAGSLLILVIISYIIRSVAQGRESGSSFDSALYAAVGAAAAGCLVPAFRLVSDFMKTVTSTADASLPVISSLLVLSGKVTSSASGAAAVSAASAVAENIFSHAALPLIASSAAIAFAESMLPERFNMSLSAFVRKAALWICVAVSTVSSFIFGAQGVLSSASDNVGIKTVKFAIGSFVPFVGGALGDTASAIISGASALKSFFGVLMLVVIFIIMLKPLSALILCKIVFGASSVIASALGGRREGRLMKELGETLSAGIAAVVSCAGIFMVISITFLICGASI